jgi:sigma-B regulation protein RsbQ
MFPWRATPEPPGQWFSCTVSARIRRPGRSWRRHSAAITGSCCSTTGGAGKSDGEAFDRDESRYLNLRGYASDLIEIGEALNLGDAVLVGHSMGAMVAALAAIERPALFARLVLIGASPRYLDAEGYRGGFTKADWQEINLAVANNYALSADAFAPLAMDNPDRPELARYFAESIKAIPVRRGFTVLYSIFQSDYRADLPKLKIPTLLIQSAADRAVPLEAAEYLHQHIEGSQLSVIDATGHLPHVSAPEEVISAMRNFGL